MLGLELHVNGRHVCTAAVGDRGVLSGMLTAGWVGAGKGEDEFRLHIGGISDELGHHIRWPTTRVRLGDEITFRVVEVDAIPEGYELGRPSEDRGPDRG